MRYPTIRRTWRCRDPREKSECTACGMLTFEDEYHPYAACAMYRETKSAHTTLSHLHEVIRFGIDMNDAAEGKE